MAAPSNAQDFNVPSGDLKSALDAYIHQSGVTVVYSPRAVAGARSRGVKAPFRLTLRSPEFLPAPVSPNITQQPAKWELFTTHLPTTTSSSLFS